MSTRLTDEQLAEIHAALDKTYRRGGSDYVLDLCDNLKLTLAHITALEAELQAAQLRPIQRSLKWSIEKMEQRAIDNFRTKLVAVVREITMTVPPTAERDGYFRTPLQVRDEAVALIEATEL